MQRLHEQCANVLLERHVGNNVNELIELKVVVNASKVVLARGASIATATTTIIDLFGDGLLLLLLLRMVDGLLGRVCIFWFFFSWYDFDQKDDGFWFFGVGKGSKGGNESGVALVKSGSHVEHELAFLPTISSQQQNFVLDGMDVIQVVFW